MQPKADKFEFKSEYLAAICALVMGSLSTWYVYSIGMIKTLTDADAHLNFSRMLFESMTPGVSQIGFWPPLLHVLMAPLTQVEFLYDTGLAGALILIPFYAMGAVFTYKLADFYTRNFWLSFAATLIYLSNPYMLYYTSVPMMEVMFVANLLGTAYFAALWLRDQKLNHLVLCALFVTLTSLSRFEGLLLLPLLALIVFVQMIKSRKSYQQTEAVLILFLLLAVVGAAVIGIYSWVFGGSPLTFMGGSWIRDSVFSFDTKNNVINSLMYILHASFYMLSQPLVIFSLVAAGLLILVSGRKFENVSVLLILLSPALFVTAALLSGSYETAVPTLAPFNIFLNERYGLTWIGFVTIAPVMLFASILERSSRLKPLRIAASASVVLAVLVLVGLNIDHMKAVAFDEKYVVIKNNINTPRAYQSKVAAYLRQKYDFGKILITRADNDPILAEAGVPLNNYIYEGNYRYFDQTMDEPWMFARWVVMYNFEDKTDAWSIQNETIARNWGGSEEFNRYYDLVFETSKRRVYKINERTIREAAQRQNLALSQIPSVNEEIKWWDPADIYTKIQGNTAFVPEDSEVKKN